MLQYTNDPKVSTPKPILGRKLAYRLRSIPPHWRARLAIELFNGTRELKKPTLKQACAVTGAALNEVVNERRRQQVGYSPAEARARALDRRIDRVVAARGGLARLVERLDEFTRPATQAAG